MSESIPPVVTSATVTYDPRFQDVLVYRTREATPILVDNEYETATVWQKSAREEYRHMAFHVLSLASHYGPDSRWATEAAMSFARVSESIIGWGNIIVSRDGDLSLFCRTRGKHPFVFGIIFHPIHNRCQVGDCPWYLGNRPFTYLRRDETPVPLHKHQWLYPADAPIPGSWSFHS